MSADHADTLATISAQREAWDERPLVRRLYSGWFEQIAARLAPVDGPVVELGAGSGGFKDHLPSVIATDIVETPWVDRTADAERLPFADGELANIVMVDVMHHLPDPAAALAEAARALVPGGRVVMVEPYCSPVSGLFYRHLHHEGADPNVDLTGPGAQSSDDPFDANNALPTLLFWRHPDLVARWAPDLRIVERAALRLARLPALGRLHQATAPAAPAVRPRAGPGASPRPAAGPPDGVSLPDRPRAPVMGTRAAAAATRARAQVTRIVEGNARSWVVAFLLIALVARLSMIFNDFSTSGDPDSVEYRFIADSLLHGDWFDGTDLRRTVGYPLFIAPLSLLPGPTIDAVVLCQHLMGIALVPIAFLVADRYFGRVPALLTGLVMALSPSMLLIEHHVLPDFLFTITVLAAAVAMVEATAGDRPSLRGLVIAGVLFGLAAHIKPNGQVLLAVAPLVLAFSTRSARDTLRGTAVVASAMVAVILPWLAYNQVEYGHPIMSAQGGQALWLRAFDQDRLEIPTDTADGVLAKRAYDEYFAEEMPGARTTESYTPVYQAFEDRGESSYEVNATMGELALEAIRRAPLEYLHGTAANVEQYAEFNHRYVDDEGALYYGGLDSEITSLRGADAVYDANGRISWALGGILWLASLAGLASVLLLWSGPRRQRLAAGVFLATWAVLAVGGSLTNYVEARFAAQVAPLQWMLVAAAAWLVVRALAAVIGPASDAEPRAGSGADPRP